MLAKVNGARNTAARCPAINRLTPHRARRDQDFGASEVCSQAADSPLPVAPALGGEAANEVGAGTETVAAWAVPASNAAAANASAANVFAATASAAARDKFVPRLAAIEALDLEPLRGAGTELTIGRESTQARLHPKAHSPPPHKWHAPTDRTGQIDRHV